MSDMTLLYKEQKSEYETCVYQNFSDINDKPEFDYNTFSPNYNRINNTLFTVKERVIGEMDFLKNYANPFAEPHMIRRTIIIEENENKIALKVYTYRSSRSATKKFFRVRKNITFLTFNLKRKQFFFGEINSKKKRKINQTLKINVPDISSTSLITKLTIASYREESEMESRPYIILEKFLNRVIERSGVEVNMDQKPETKYYELVLNFQKIKYPDAFSKFSTMYQPVKKIRECDSNLVTYFMKEFNLKGKKVKGLLNKYNNIDIDSICVIHRRLGVDVFNRIKDRAFFTKKEYSASFIPVEYYGYENENEFKEVSKKELDNIIEIINTSTTEECMSIILEHLKFQKNLKKYGENLKIESKTFDDFIYEHSEVSALLQSYKNGYVERYYGDDAKLVEEQIFSDEYSFFPKLLTNTNEYEEESSHQHNCVRTYVEKPYCFIISLRKGSINSNERATLEYRYVANRVERVQSRGKYNKTLSEEWETPMKELDGYVSHLFKNELLKLPKMVKKYKNGKVFKSQAVFTKETKDKRVVIDMFPVWDDKDVNSVFDTFYLEPFDDLP
jgi:hypothetical protein